MLSLGLGLVFFGLGLGLCLEPCGLVNNVMMILLVWQPIGWISCKQSTV